jgi:hypothetical protein
MRPGRPIASHFSRSGWMKAAPHKWVRTLFDLHAVQRALYAFHTKS